MPLCYRKVSIIFKELFESTKMKSSIELGYINNGEIYPIILALKNVKNLIIILQEVQPFLYLSNNQMYMYLIVHLYLFSVYYLIIILKIFNV